MTLFQTFLEQVTKKSWWGDQELIKMSAPQACASTIKEALRQECRMLSMEDLIDHTGYTKAQLRTGLKILTDNDELSSRRETINKNISIKFWGLK